MPNRFSFNFYCFKEEWEILKFHLQIQIGGVECLAVRISYTGELGWEIYIPMDKMKQVYQEIILKGFPNFRF